MTAVIARSNSVEPYPVRSRGYRRITAALFIAGVTTFGSMYSTQAVLPEFTRYFGVSPATSALAMSLTTGMLALTIIPASALSARFGRTRVMTISAVSAAVIGILIPLSPTIEVVLTLRALQGVALAGVPAVAMAYLAEEVDRASLGQAMGRYIAGTTVGALIGRLLASSMLDVTSWRWALEVAALVAAFSAIVMIRMLPQSRMFCPQRTTPSTVARGVASHLKNPAMLSLFMLSFLLMGGFVSVYNFLGYRLLDDPFRLTATLAGLVFLFYLSGTVSSPKAGQLSDRFGQRRILLGAVAIMACGLFLTLPDYMPTLLTGVAIFTIGFFGAHSVASSWVSNLAASNRAEASSLYLFSYYLGSSLLGGTAGLVYMSAGWSGMVVYVGVLVIVGLLLVTVTLRSRNQGLSAPVSRLSAG
ncbi:MFS transporter [Hoyosella altamirensis]|uniref:Putative MFS family arabinose efflux permease n=1 Tax=Hoyosella altamirensis TaxID=616997 RepID=A0A839RKG1_9ACTN|nr:MFS transporter [Hoyosella altamirensis]MBB3037155.1 putative MFS family arabinose efflux permease [Hoyosella altamirensis]